jgi:hypothetical protein
VTIRERVNEKPALAGVAVAFVALTAVLLALKFSGSTPRAAGGSATAKQFFSTDDGETWFVDEASKIPPFDRDGKPAYRARVFKCEHGQEFVSHLERYGEDARKRLSDMMAKGAKEQGGMAVEQFGFAHELEVKKPKDRRWVKMGGDTAAEYQKATQPKCPHGSTTGAQPVLPK